MQDATAAAWSSPWGNAATAAASVLNQAQEQGAFKLPGPLASIVRGFAAPAPVAASTPSPVANVPRPPPAADPGIVARVGRWIRANPLLAGLAAAAVVGLVVVLRRRKA